MKTVTFYGSSDDNLCVEGDINDEFSAYSEARQVCFYANGKSLPVFVIGEYDADGYDGKWKIAIDSYLPKEFTSKHEPATDTNANYSDRLTITGPFDDIKSVLKSDELHDALADFDWRDLSESKQREVGSIIGIC